MTALRIAHILPWDSLGGTEWAALRLAEAAAACGCVNHIFCPAGSSLVTGPFQAAGFPLEFYDQVQPSLTHPLAHLRASRALAREFRRREIHIVHCANILGAHFTALAARLAGAVLVCHVRNIYSDHPPRDRMFLWPIQQFVFVSRSARARFYRRVPDGRATLLYDIPSAVMAGVCDVDAARASFGLRPGSHVIGMAARVAPPKDFVTLVRAAQIVAASEPDCEFLIAGPYEGEPFREYFAALQLLLRETAMEGRFHFAGLQHDMARFYSAIDTFVLSSDTEGLPLVLLEAMRYKRPVVATDVGGISEVVSEGQTGFLVPLRSPGVLAERLLSLIRNPDEARRLGENGYRVVEENFGAPRFEREVCAMYRRFATQYDLPAPGGASEL